MHLLSNSSIVSFAASAATGSGAAAGKSSRSTNMAAPFAARRRSYLNGIAHSTNSASLSTEQKQKPSFVIGLFCFVFLLICFILFCFFVCFFGCFFFSWFLMFIYSKNILLLKSISIIYAYYLFILLFILTIVFNCLCAFST